MIPPSSLAAVLLPAGPPVLLVRMLASKSQFALVVKGGIVGLAAATATILIIWVHEMRRGRIW